MEDIPMIRKQKVSYIQDNIRLEGFLAYDEDDLQQRPVILIAPAWRGLDNFAQKKAEQLASAGYVGFAMDLYGEGIQASSDDQAFSLMKPLFVDRTTLRKRTLAAFQMAKTFPMADSTKIGGIGFCFGGLTILELAKSGADVRGVVSFHGLLGNAIGDVHAEELPLNNPILAKILVLHGYDDPLVSANDIASFQKNMSEASVDWQMVVYGGTTHAFTNPEAKESGKGLLYNPVAEKRAWKSMLIFFEEVFERNYELVR